LSKNCQKLSKKKLKNLKKLAKSCQGVVKNIISWQKVDEKFSKNAKKVVKNQSKSCIQICQKLSLLLRLSEEEEEEEEEEHCAS
jgi:hypothetical protein